LARFLVNDVGSAVEPVALHPESLDSTGLGICKGACRLGAENCGKNKSSCQFYAIHSFVITEAF
jgi:hypothetical protein